MKLEFKVWLYGTRADKTKKTLIRIADDALSRARGFHLFIKKSSRSKWARVTPGVELFPSGFRSKFDKQIYIDSYIDAVRSELDFKKEPPAIPEPPPQIGPEIKEIELPELPKEPRVTLTKKQFNAQMSRILYDELDLENMKWSANRIDSFVNKLWKSYSHAPHLINSEQFRRGLVTKEIKRLRDKRLRKKEGELETAYRKSLEQKDISLEPGEMGGNVKIIFKEVFNTQGMKTPDELTMKTLENGLIIEKERQSAFTQVQVDYDKLMVISKDQLLGNDKMADIAFDKVRKDIDKLFTQALEKGLFKGSNTPEYSIRLLVPLLDGRGEIPVDYYSKKGRKRTGHGFSTVREKIKSRKDLNTILDGLFSSVRPALARYIKLNRSAGFMIAGFTIERLIR
jgi:hypothetical protein